MTLMVFTIYVSCCKMHEKQTNHQRQAELLPNYSKYLSHSNDTKLHIKIYI